MREPSRVTKLIDPSVLAQCPDCGGPRRSDTCGKVLEYHHTATCAQVAESRRFWSVLTGGTDGTR